MPLLVGTIPLGLILLLRLTGVFQEWEWLIFDTFLRLRPTEPTDERIVIVGMTEEDIQDIGTYPIPDTEIANLINLLQSYQPNVIGLDIVRDLPVQPGHQQLQKIWQTYPNIIGIEKILSPTIQPPPDLPSEQIGFADILIDRDGQTRRNLLGIYRPTNQDKYAFSFSLLLAKHYLESEKILLKNGIKDSQAMRFQYIEIPRFHSHTGGYLGAEDFGVQMLLNYRQGKKPFRVLSLNEVKQEKFKPEWIKNRIILIGMTAPSVKDFVNTNALVNTTLSGQIYGVEFHAHAISNIISAVKDQRPLLKSWSEGWDYIWIIVWGLMGFSISYYLKSPLKSFFLVGLSGICLILLTYSLLLMGWWIPLVPALLILGFNGIGLTAFFQYNRFMQEKIKQRQETIEHTFSLIHNGALQTLASILRQVQDKSISQDQLLEQLENLNKEIRDLGDYLKKDALDEKESLRLGNGVILELNTPIHQLFFEVYNYTLEREFPCFSSLKVRVRDFDPIEDKYLTFNLKRELCQFLEEALCNVGKHAKGVLRLTVTGKKKDNYYTLTIKDNGMGIASIRQGRGTKQCQNLAKKLGGEFKRESLSPKGTLCELSWLIDRKK